MILHEFSFQEEIPEEDTTRMLPVPFRMFFNIYCAAVFECGNKEWKMKWEVRDPAMEQYGQKINFLLELGM